MCTASEDIVLRYEKQIYVSTNIFYGEENFLFYSY